MSAEIVKASFYDSKTNEINVTACHLHLYPIQPPDQLINTKPHPDLTLYTLLKESTQLLGEIAIHH